MAPGGDSAVMAKGLTAPALSGRHYCSRRSSSSASAASIDGSGPAPLVRRTAKSRHQLQLGVDGVDVAHLATRASQQSMSGG